MCCQTGQHSTGNNNPLSASSTTQRPIPGHQYYTPKPQLSKNPFLPDKFQKPGTLKPGNSSPNLSQSGLSNSIPNVFLKPQKPQPTDNTIVEGEAYNPITTLAPFELSPSGLSTVKNNNPNFQQSVGPQLVTITNKYLPSTPDILAITTPKNEVTKLSITTESSIFFNKNNNGVTTIGTPFEKGNENYL